MGIITGILISTQCCGACAIEDLPDNNYNFLSLGEQKKDGLDIYKPQSTISYVNQLRCPLCKLSIPAKEKPLIQKLLANASEDTLNYLVSKYNTEVDSAKEIDNIKVLESIYKQIQEYAKTVEDNRYYRHTCIKNNRDIYIDLCSNSPQETIKNKMKIDFNKLKTDEDYKNQYLEKREIAYEKHIREQKRRQIENKYRDDFESYTFKKEQNRYEWATRNIRDKYERHLEFEGRKGPNDIRSEFQASSEWYKEKSSFKYSATKKKLLNFIENLTGQKINDSVSMGDQEYKEFQKYILQRDEDYSELI